jgi:hypothetical protein
MLYGQGGPQRVGEVGVFAVAPYVQVDRVVEQSAKPRRIHPSQLTDTKVAEKSISSRRPPLRQQLGEFGLRRPASNAFWYHPTQRQRCDDFPVVRAPVLI